MKLVVDANVLISALIKEGKTDDVLFMPFLELNTVDFVFEEFYKHGIEIIKKTKRNAESFIYLYEAFSKTINTFPVSNYKDKLKEAEIISPDPNDYHYFALALKLNCPIWSNDKRLQNQDKVKIYTTEDLINKLNL